MYKSPIEIKIDDIVSDAVERVDKYIVRYIQQVGVNVDKDELVKALKFDREQYEKGWNDRDTEIVRCKDCIYRRHDSKRGYMCDMDSLDPYEQTRGVDDGEWYCADGERREDGKTD